MTTSDRMLTTSDVTIKEVSVEIKVLKINNKQMTLAVFRQLPDLLIFDCKTGILKGAPWGRVNYHVGCSEEMSGHIHVVWQKEQQLYRSTAFLPWNYQEHMVPNNTYHNIIGELQWAAYNFLMARTLEGWVPENRAQLNHFVEIHGRRIRVELEQGDNLERAWIHSRNPAIMNTFKEKMREDLQRNKFPLESSDYDKHFLPLEEELCKFKKQWQQSYAQLEQLDQLFIAV